MVRLPRAVIVRRASIVPIKLDRASARVMRAAFAFAPRIRVQEKLDPDGFFGKLLAGHASDGARAAVCGQRSRDTPTAYGQCLSGRGAVASRSAMPFASSNDGGSTPRARARRRPSFISVASSRACSTVIS